MTRRSEGILPAALACLLPVFAAAATASAAGPAPDLPPKYRAWLSEEVVYIITPKERDVFLQLASDRERDLFIDAFWRHRDPVPQTPVNEFREEHDRRIAYADRYLGRGSSKPGWKTDRGRIYIILGKPANTVSYGGEQINLVPIEVWFYQGDYGPGMPPSFYVVFFQEEGLGDYILYSPLRHGPRKLLEAYDGDPGQAVNRIQRVDRELANVSLSLIPGRSSTFGREPALDSEMLLDKLAVLPQRKVDDLYAEKLLKYRSLVEVDHSVNYVGNEALLKVIRERDGRYFVHYAVEPNTLSIGLTDGRYVVRLEIYGKVSDPSGTTVHQFKKDVSMEPDPDQVREMKAKRFSFQDAFPLIAGRFRFDLLIKNPVSKEFTSFEEEVTVPGPSAALGLGPIILSSRRERPAPPEPGVRPFRVGGVQLYPVANRTFKRSDPLFVAFDVRGAAPGPNEAGRVDIALFREGERVLSLTKALGDYPEEEGYCERLDLDPYEPGLFSVSVGLRSADGKDAGASKEDFVVSPEPALSSTWSLSEMGPPADDPAFTHVLGTELLNVERTEEAKGLLEEAYRARPGSLEFALSLAQAYVRSEEWSKVDDLLTRFLERAGEQPQIYDWLGRASFHRGDFGKAAYYFKKDLSRFGTNLEILNLLAESFYRIGEIEQARSAWKKSLEVEPRQEAVRKRLEALDKAPADPRPSSKEAPGS